MINEQIKETLREFNIPVKDGISYLLTLYYDVVPSYVPIDLVGKVQITGIYKLDLKSGTLEWVIPLLDGQVTGFEWVLAWMEEFEAINKDRKGVKKYVVSRMKKFFADNPSIRQEEVIGATRMYFRNVDNPTYLKSSHKFIMEGKGADKYSMLFEWVEKYRNMVGIEERRKSVTNTMQS